MPVSALPDGSIQAAAKTLHLNGVRLDHRGGDGQPFRVLDIPDLTIPAGARVGLRGPSGSGKTSLLHLIAGLIVLDAGTVAWDGRAVSSLPISARDRWRRKTIGFVFQDFHLIPELDVAMNITLPATFSSWRIDRVQHECAAALAVRMGLGDLRRKARALSRGEQQRVAIARAVLGRPALILADEPTASLDAEHADEVGALLVEVAQEAGATLICASHDQALLARMERVVEIGALTGKPLALAS